MNARIALVSCSAMKLDAPAAARDLYCSPLFKLQRRWAELRFDRWFILSAKHGLVLPDQRLEPYDRRLEDYSSQERRLWGAHVIEQLRTSTRGIARCLIEVYAGSAYYEALAGRMRPEEWSLCSPFHGLGIGQRLQRLGQMIERDTRWTNPTQSGEVL